MKIQIILVLIVITVYSCKQEKESNEVEQRISQVLPYEMGTLTFTNYLSFDTSYTWHDVSDSRCVGSVKTRYQIKTDSIYKESGFFSISQPPEKRCYMTFILPEYENCQPKNIDLEYIVERKKERENLSKSSGYFIAKFLMLKNMNNVFITANFNGKTTNFKVDFFINKQPMTIVLEKSSSKIDTIFSNACLKTIESFILN